MPHNLPRLAWFSPINTEEVKSETLSAYVTDQLLPYLRKSFEITVFHNGFEDYQDFETAHFLSAWKHHEKNPFDIFFYQLEDSFESNFIRQYSGVMPGALWFHDFLFASHGPEPILNSPFQDVIKLYNGELKGLKVRGHEYDERERSGIREAGLSVTRFFSREIALSECERRLENALSFSHSEERIGSMFLPIPIPKPTPLKDTSDKPWRIVYCGSPQIEHRGHKLFQAVKELEGELPIVWLVNPDEEEIARDLVKEFEIDTVEIIGERTPLRWKSLVEESHYQSIAIHTHFSVYRQSGPYLQLSLGAGLPTLISEFGGGEFYPDALTFKIDSGDTESSQIREVLHSLTSNQVLVDKASLQNFASDRFSVEQIADELTFALTRSLPAFKECRDKWDAILNEARKDTVSFSLSKNFGRAEDELFGKAHGGKLTRDLQEVYKELSFL